MFHGGVWPPIRGYDGHLSSTKYCLRCCGTVILHPVVVPSALVGRLVPDDSSRIVSKSETETLRQRVDCRSFRISSSTTLFIGNSDRYRGVFLAMEVPQIQFIDSVEDTPVWQERQVPWRYSLVEVPQFLCGRLHSTLSAAHSLLTGVRSRTVRSWTCPLPRFKCVFRSGSSDRSSIWQCPRLASAGLAHRRAPPFRECFAEVHGVVSSTVVDWVLLPHWYRQNAVPVHSPGSHRADVSICGPWANTTSQHRRRFSVPAHGDPPRAGGRPGPQRRRFCHHQSLPRSSWSSFCAAVPLAW